IRASPPKAASGRKASAPGLFDTALLIENPSTYCPSSSFQGLRAAQIRVIFKLPPQFGFYAHPLAYIEWFTPLGVPDRVTGLHSVTRSTRSLR
ncbi:hypothetical protein CPC08DRAFT_591998, partial [Agrocybe pediades]